MRQTVIGILKDERGVLTLLEMLTVMAILAILIVTLLPAQDAVINDAKVMATAEDLEIIKKALLKFHADIGVWPLSSDNGGKAAPADGLADVNLMGDTCGASSTTENSSTNSPGILCQGNTNATVSIGPQNNGSFTTTSGQFLVRKWRGPYIRREIKSNPFGGSYVLSFAKLPNNAQPGHNAFQADGGDAQSVLIQATRIPKTAAVAIDRLLDDGRNSTGFVQYNTTTLTLTFVADGF